MAKVKGIIQITGTIDGINYYLRKGKLVARKAGGGFEGEAIALKPSMEKVRQNSSEFGRVSRMVKIFKLGIAPFLYGHRFPDLHGQLVRLFTAVKNTDCVSSRGMRDFVTGLGSEDGMRMLLGFSVPSYSKYWSGLHHHVHFDWESFSLVFRSTSGFSFVFPKGVDALSFEVAVLQWGDLENECVLTRSTPIFVTSNDFLQSFVAVPVEGLVGNGSLAIVSLRHYERIGDVLRPIDLKSGFYMEVVSIF